jgi:hypothetical protein
MPTSRAMRHSLLYVAVVPALTPRHHAKDEGGWGRASFSLCTGIKLCAHGDRGNETKLSTACSERVRAWPTPPMLRCRPVRTLACATPATLCVY